MNATDTTDRFTGSEIAIIGMSGRFAKARNLDEFWQNLREGVESSVFLTPDEIARAGLGGDALNNGNYVNVAYPLDDVENFDAAFFGINPREAEIMDPQHRLFLECAWEVLEDAGYDTDRYTGAIGVYGGTRVSTYLLNLLTSSKLNGTTSRMQLMMANDKDHLTTRVSYKLNLRGPSINVQTTCSTSLVAAHLACQALLNRECDMALAGGAAISFPQKTGYFYQEGNINSPDGHCRAFDARAQGTVGGNGVAIVLLKRLEDAIEDGDHIHAVIRGSAINNDGSQKVGYTAPSIDGQSEVIVEALALAGVEPETVSYVETHGTGTTLGDPIEIAALTKAFRTSTVKNGFCAIGSVKTNLGHLDTAAGVAGLIKTVLALKHGEIPPSLHFEEPNPKIDFGNSPFYVNSSLQEWKRGETPRRAGVSSFGIGGTNAHIVLEEAPPPVAASSESRPWQLIPLSAKTTTSLDAMTAGLLKYLRQETDVKLPDVAYTLHVGRKAFNHRRILVCRGPEDGINALERMDGGPVLTGEVKPGDRRVLFMFPGQGSQYVGMGSELYQNEAAFRNEIDRCAEALVPHLGKDIREIIYPPAEKQKEAQHLIRETSITQPALFTIEYALARLWMEWGVTPRGMIGHSVGEYVAACLADVMSLEDALSLVAKRGRLMQQLPRGSMLAVPLGESEIQPLLTGRLALAAVNSPDLCVVSGPRQAVFELEKELNGRGLSCGRLHTSHAFHSYMMDPIVEPFTELVSKISLRPPRLPYISNLTGDWITADEATSPNYWSNHLRQPVRFGDAAGLLTKNADQILLEVGPGQTLSTLVRRHPDKSADQVLLSSLPHPKTRRSDLEYALTTLGRLWLTGLDVDWKNFYARERRLRTSLPGYSFERKKYWIGLADNGELEPSESCAVTEKKNGSDSRAQGPGDVFIEETVLNSIAESSPTQVIARLPAATVASHSGRNNGNGRQRPSSSSRSQIITQQLSLISQQLDVLRNQRLHKQS